MTASSGDLENLKYRSKWDEVPSTANNKNIVSNIKTSVNTVHLQLFGVIGVLLFIIAIVVPLTIVIKDINTNTTILVSTTIVTTNATTKTTTTTTITASTTKTTTTTTITASTTKTTTTTTTPNPYACSTMIFLNNTDLGGNDIPPNPVLNYSTCCTLCLTTSGCVALTWGIVTNICYPKSSAGSGDTFSISFVSARY